MEFNLLVVIICVTSLIVVELLMYAYRNVRNPDRNKIQRRLRTVQGMENGTKDIDILRRRELSEVPAVNAILSRIHIARRIDNLLVQANTHLPLGFYILLTLLLGFSGYLVGFTITHSYLLGVVVGMMVLPLPFLYLKRRKTRRLQRLERQLPDGLDLIARALKAGHAFTSGMRMAAEEIPDPFGTAMQEAIDEVNFGISLRDALKGMANRYDSQDLKFFVVAAVIQHETGGNLVEVMESISRIIRERFKLYGKIRALSAEARISAWVLVAIPVFVCIVLVFLNPDYVGILFDQFVGRVMLAIGVGMMATGILVMKKTVRIRV
jgi:tight adherence protein B